jgi:hapalindole H/12-epi-hapalindole U/12-epi-fischerindole U synthase
MEIPMQACRFERRLGRIRSIALTLLAASASAHTAEPVTLDVVNAGFEAQAVAPGAFLIGVPTGWQAWDPNGRLDGNADALGRIAPVASPAPGSDYFPNGPAEGQRAALVFLSGAEPGEAGLRQTLTATLAANTLYTLTVAVGNIASGTSVPGSSDGGGVFHNLAGFPGYRLDLLAGGVPIAQDLNSQAALIGEGQWLDVSLSVDSRTLGAALQGLPLQIRLVNLAQPGPPAAPGIEVDFDAVRLTALAVPEPGGLAMALAGLVVLAAHRRTASRRGGRAE